MNNSEISNLITGVLSNLNITDVCLCPGARNSPIISSFISNDFNTHFILDERSAGFYALGIAKTSNKPMIICCTSGTALGNLFPAIIEARMSEIPLIIITADRPKKLIGKGENQTIYQEDIYGKYVCHHTILDKSDETKESMIDKINTTVNLSLGEADGLGRLEKGPVHINVHIDEPLINSNLSSNLGDFIINPIKSKISSNQTLKINKEIKRPLIICGQSDLENSTNKIIEISKKIGAPILADISSNINSSNNIISFYDHFIDDIEPPDLILRFGSKPLSKRLRSLLKNYHAITYLVRNRKIFNDDILESHLISSILSDSQINNQNSDWINSFIEKDTLINNKIGEISNRFDLNEYILAHQIIKRIPKGSNVFIGNSLMIRAFNSFSKKTQKGIRFFSNRGASGIDGNLSTALGIASQSDKNNYLFIGDQSFMHDIGSLQILAENKIKLTVFIINNYGGAIFDYLPILNRIEPKTFKKFIRNEHTTSFSSIIKSYQLEYNEIKNSADLKNIDMEKIKVYEVLIDNQNSLKFIRQFSTSLYQ